MAFIIDQQAKFSVGIQMLQEAQARTTADVQKLREAQERTDGMLRQLIDVNLSLANHVGALDEKLLAFDERLLALDERLIRLAESGAHTDRRLDALIDVVDKLARRQP